MSLEILSACPAPRPAADPAAPRSPVLLHGLWRSGTTYLWSRFRANPQTCCYYEPLHEGLHRLTSERIGRADAQAVAGARHPELSQPYFAEFAPLIRNRRGVGGLSPRFAHERFALDPDEPHDGLEAYLRGLITHPAAGERRVVLGFNRSSLRIAWLRRRFQAHHIHVERDPAEIWTSYLRHLSNGNAFFLTAWLSVVERNAAHPLFAGLAERLPIRRSWRDRMVKPKAFYADALSKMELRTSYLLVFQMWRLSLLHALSNCDQVFDYARAGEPGYADAFCDELHAAAGLWIDLEGLRPSGEAGLAVCSQAEVEGEALGLVPGDALDGYVDRAAVLRRLHQLAPRKAALVHRLL
jgi:hypothetical protein